MEILERLEPRGVFRFFEELCAIPHGSGNTKGVSDWLMAFARERNPSGSLTELAAMMEPPITKPAMNNRMKKLAAIAKETVQ